MVATPGWRAAKSVQLRPLRGNSRTVVALTVALISELAVCMAGASVETSILWETVPMRNARSKTCCDPTLILIPEFVVTVVVIPVATFRIETCACGTYFSEGSVIVPESVPPATWPRAGAEKEIPIMKRTAIVQQNKYPAEIFREDT